MPRARQSKFLLGPRWLCSLLANAWSMICTSVIDANCSDGPLGARYLRLYHSRLPFSNYMVGLRTCIFAAIRFSSQLHQWPKFHFVESYVSSAKMGNPFSNMLFLLQHYSKPFSA